MTAGIFEGFDTDKDTTHSYGPLYERIFSRFDKESEINLLEIGVWHGGSLAAWRKYFPNANIYGIEKGNTLSTDCIDLDKDPKMFFVSSDIKDWIAPVQFDIVIDDGSHELSDIEWVASHYPSRLKKGGVLIIEDISDISWGDIIRQALPGGYSMTIEDLREEKGRSDDIVAIIIKGY